MLAQSEFIEFLKLFDDEVLGAVFIIGTIGIFISFITLVVSVTRTWNNIAMVRMNQRLVQELLQKGYSVDDIERLAYGGNVWRQQFRKMIDSAKAQFANLAKRHRHENPPAPPFKQSA